jgi:ubiquinone/menaquinone biosynthesis C-methylase UbiE
MQLIQFLNQFSAGKVLDAATGAGGFASFFIQHVKAFDTLVGVDCVERCAGPFGQTFAGQPKVSFQWMDVGHLDFPDASFDTVCMASSLHHLNRPEQTLAELRRVLRPGGCCILSEMYCDQQSEAQLTHVLLHHWWAAVNTAEGICHHETFTRAALLDLLAGMGLEGWQYEDHSELQEDPRDEEGIRQMDAVIEQYLQRADALPGAPALRARGEELRSRLHVVGIHGATELIAVGYKPGS